MLLYSIDTRETARTRTVLLYGRDAESHTVCWRVHDLPFAVLYFELHSDVPADQQVTQADVIAFLPELAPYRLIVAATTVDRRVAPIVSHGVKGDDLHDHFRDDRVSSMHAYHKGSTKIRVVEVLVMSRPTGGWLRVDNTTPLTRHSVLYKSRGPICNVWAPSYTLEEMVLLYKRINMCSWLYTDTAPVEVTDTRERLTNCHREFLVGFDALRSAPAATATSGDGNLLSFNVMYLDLKRLHDGKPRITVAATAWHPSAKSGSRRLKEGDRFVTLMLRSSSSLADRTERTQCLQLYDDIEALVAAVNAYVASCDVHVIVTRHWKTFARDELTRLGVVLSRCRSAAQSTGGIVVCDTAVLFERKKQYIDKSASYNLQALAAQHLSSMEEVVMWSQQHLSTVGSDVAITHALFTKFGILSVLYQWASTSHAPWQIVCNGSMPQCNEWLLNRAFHDAGFIVRRHKEVFEAVELRTKSPEQYEPVDEDDDVEEPAKAEAISAGLKGGLKLEPVVGMHRNVALLDFKSMYPSIVSAGNLCFSTLNCDLFNPQRGTLHTSYYKPLQLLKPLARRSPAVRGVIPLLFQRLLDERTELQTRLADATVSDAERSLLSARSKTLKLIANSIYGCIGRADFRYYSIALGNMITNLARETLTHIDKVVVPSMADICGVALSVVFGETDSILVKPQVEARPGEDHDDVAIALLNRASDALVARVQQLFPGLTLQREQFFSHVVMVRKSMYMGAPLSLVRGRTNDNPCIALSDQYAWKSLAMHEFGIAPFVKSFIQETVLLYASCCAYIAPPPATARCNSCGHCDSCSALRRAVKAREDLFIEQTTTQLLRRLILELRNNVGSLERFVITSRLKAPVESYAPDVREPHIHAARGALWLYNEGNMEEGCVYHPGDNVEWVMGYSHSFYTAMAYPASAFRVTPCLKTVNEDWYLNSHLVTHLYEVVHRLLVVTKFTKQILEEHIRAEWLRTCTSARVHKLTKTA